MKINFKKISAIGASILMAGMSLGVAAAANYPAPFVSGGTANVAIVYGTGEGVSSLDLLEAGNIQSSLQSFMTGTTGGTTSTSGEIVSLDSSADRIWLNTSLNAVKSTLTKSDLPTVLADYTFSGDVTSKVTSTIKIIAGNTATTASSQNTGTVIFAKQPDSSDDPVVGISLGTSQTPYPLYNASVTMSAINFTDADSEGEEIALFGQTFTVASETDSDTLVLLKDAKKVTLSVPSNPSTTVTIGGETYTVRLITASSTSANIEVTNSAGVSASKEINEADSKSINGIDVAVTTATSSSLESVGESASIIVGVEKITLENGAIVTVGEDDDPIDGTYAYIIGGNTDNDNPVNSTTEITIAVFRPDSSSDAILPGEPFVDPVFGSFKLDFAGLSSPLDDANREIISVTNSGDDTMTVKFKEQGGYEKSVDFAHNESGIWKLGDDSNYSIALVEMANLSYSSDIGSGGLGTIDDGVAKYVVVGNEDFGHLLELYDVYNQTSGSSAITNDRVKFRDAFTDEVYETTFTSTEGSGTIDVDGKRYNVYFNGTGEAAYVQIKYPTSESAVNEYVVFPTIETVNGALVAFYQPLVLNLSDMNSSAGRGDAVGGGADGFGTNVSTLKLPNGDGYTSVTLRVYNNADVSCWNVSGNATHALVTNSTEATWDSTSSNTNVTFTVGTLTYMLTSVGEINQTMLSLVDPESTTDFVRIDQPGLVVFEGKDDKSAYHAIVVDLNNHPAGDSTTPVEVNDVLFSSDYYHTAATRSSDSDLTDDVDWWGTLVTKDASDTATTATISIPKSQVYAQIYLGEISSAVSSTPGVSGTTQLGEVIYKDSESSSYSAKNVIVVGGSCINSAAAALLGEPACGARFTELTTAGSGQFLIKGYATSSVTSELALLVAGYNVGDTTNAAKYLRTQTVDTSKAYIGTSSTSATLQTTEA